MTDDRTSGQIVDLEIERARRMTKTLKGRNKRDDGAAKKALKKPQWQDDYRKLDERQYQPPRDPDGGSAA